VHLVLSATTSFTGLLNILNAYSYLSDFKLVLTKLDETPTWGTLLNARFLSDRPISYTAIGQNVPDDIEVVDVESIAKEIIRGQGPERDMESEVQDEVSKVEELKAEPAAGLQRPDLDMDPEPAVQNSAAGATNGMFIMDNGEPGKGKSSFESDAMRIIELSEIVDE
jgi:hypothetical protein